MLEDIVAAWERQLNQDLIEQRDILHAEETELNRIKSLYHEENEKNKTLESELDKRRVDLSYLNISQSSINNSMDASLTMSMVESTVSDIKHLESPEVKLANLTRQVNDFQKKLITIQNYKDKLYKTCMYLKSREKDLNQENKFLRKRVISLTDRFYVVCRISPLKPSLLSSGDYSIFTDLTNSDLNAGNKLSSTSITIDNKKYNFDSIISKDESEKKLYKTLINPFISTNFAGASICYVTYGQTGSGKSHTINQLFSCYITKINEFYSAMKITLNYNVYEIYNNKLQKLAEENFELGNGVDKTKDILKAHERISSIRRTSTNKHNLNSNRSHTIFQISVSNKVRSSKEIFFIDLAGSEKNKFSSKSKISEKETIFINESLSNLKLLVREIKGNRIVSGHKVSTLNKFMVDNIIKPNTKFVFIGTVSESFLCYKDSINTLRFMEDLMSVTLSNLKSNKVSKYTKPDSNLLKDENAKEGNKIKTHFGSIMRRFDKAKKNGEL